MHSLFTLAFYSRGNVRPPVHVTGQVGCLPLPRAARRLPTPLCPRGMFTACIKPFARVLCTALHFQVNTFGITFPPWIGNIGLYMEPTVAFLTK